MEENYSHSEELKIQFDKTIRRSKMFAYLTIASTVLSFLQLVIGFFTSNGFNALSILPFIISTAISLILAFNLVKYSKLIQQYTETGDNTYFSVGLSHLKNFFMVLGIIFIILISLIFISILIAIITFAAKSI